MINEKPSVLHIAYDLIRGGTEGQCARVAMEMAQRGHRHRVAVFHGRGFFLDPVTERCGEPFEIGITRMATIDTLKRVLRLSKWIRTQRFDVVHGWDMDACIFGFLAARLAGVPFISSRRNMSDVMPAYKRKMLKNTDRWASCVVVNSEKIKDFVLSQGVEESRIRRIPNIIDLAEFDRLSLDEPAGLPPRKQAIRMCCVCRLDLEKDVGTLLYAMELLRERGVSAEIVIVGDGTERPRLEGLTKRLGIQEWVVFMGERPDVPAILRECDLGILVPKSNEGLSNSIIEYMAAGLPVVATDCGGNAELVGPPERGLIVPIELPDALARSVEELANSPADIQSSGKAARRFVETHFGMDIIADQFQQMYVDCSKAPRA